MEQKSAFESFELDVNEDIRSFLKDTSKWTSFISIIGFVGIGLMVIGGILVGFFSGLSEIPENTAYGVGYSAGVGMFYLIIALVYFFPILYLFKFSKKMKSALALNNNEDFKMAFLNLKSHYKFMGIFINVIITLYILIFIGAIVSTSIF